MGFLSPWFLGGLLAAGLPIYFHLLRQHKSTPRPFSSLMLFERTTQSSIKHRRLRHLALLALRVALLLLLTLAFASPYINREVIAGGGGKKLSIIVIDNTFSMREGTRLEDARRAALAVASELGGDDEGQVATLGSRLHFLTEPAASAVELAAAIRSVKPSDSRGSFGELSRALRAVAKASANPLEVHFFSDVQRSSMPQGFAELQLPDSATFLVHPVGDSEVTNAAVETVIAPPSVFDTSRVTVQATLTSRGPETVKREVRLLADGKELESATVEIPENGRATVEFHSLDVPHGYNRCQVDITPADSLPEDDRFLFAVERADPRPLLFVQRRSSARDGVYFRSALEASPHGGFRVQTVEQGQAAGIDPSRFAVVVLSDPGRLPEGFEQKLRRWVRNGGSLLVAAGPSSARLERLPVTGMTVTANRYSGRSGERFQTASVSDAAHPAMHGDIGLESVKFFQSVGLDAGEGRVLARLGDTHPLLIETELGEGRVLTFASTFDNISNDFPLLPGFVPFVEQTVHYLGGVEERTSLLDVDSHLELRRTGAPAQGIEVIGPGGDRIVSLEESLATSTLQLSEAGFYEVRRPNDRNEMVAVNADRRESDLAVMNPETITLWQNTGQAPVNEGEQSETVTAPWSFWWYVLLLALLAVLGETLLSGRYLTVERGVS